MERLADDRKERERRFFDDLYARGLRGGLVRNLVLRFRRRVNRCLKPSRQFYRDALVALARDRNLRVLEIGFGADSVAFELVQHGAQVDVIDLSAVAVARLEEEITKRGLTGRIRAVCGDAEKTMFPDDTFDVVCGKWILHHLRLAEAMPEIARIVRRGGRAVFIEPLGTNPLINAFRVLTPALRTRDEQPFRVRDTRFVAGFFENATIRYFHLFFWVAPVLPDSPRVFQRLSALEQWLFRTCPFLGPLGWQTVMVLADPKKSGRDDEGRRSRVLR